MLTSQKSRKCRFSVAGSLLVLAVGFAMAMDFSMPASAAAALPEASADLLDSPADSPEPGDLSEGVMPQEQQGPVNAGRKRKSAKGGRARDRNSEKETDGTQARDRFEVTTAVKSKYESGGQPLEVDTD